MTLDDLKNKRLIWQASQTSGPGNTCHTGFDELDQHLQGGFPEQGVVDINSPIGIGELRLLLPSFLLRQQQADKLLVFIAPPALLSSQMLFEFGFKLEQILIIQTTTTEHGLWAAEQCLKSGCCDGILLWQQALEIHQVKRLQLAAEKGAALGMVFRSVEKSCFSLPVPLALTLSADSQGIKVRITKRKGGARTEAFTVGMHQRWPALTLAAAVDNVLPFSGPHSRTG